MQNSMGTSTYPDVYVKTKNATALAVVKGIEAIIVAFLLVGMLGILPTGNLLNNLKLPTVSEDILPLVNAFQFLTTTLVFLSNASHYLLVLGLLVAFIECIAVVCIRITGRFSWIIRLIHTIITILMSLCIILMLAGCFMMFASLSQSDGNLLATYTIGVLVYFVGFLFIGVGLTFSYHISIIKITKALGKEKKSGIRQVLRKKNRLPGECRWFVFCLALEIVAQLLLWILPFIQQSIPQLATNSIIIFANWLVINITGIRLFDIIITAFLALKFYLIGKCAKDFNLAHNAR